MLYLTHNSYYCRQFCYLVKEIITFYQKGRLSINEKAHPEGCKDIMLVTQQEFIPGEISNLSV